MTAKETPGSRLLVLLQRLPGWSKSLDAIQIRILAEGIASLYRQMIEGLSIDESLLSEIVDSLPGSDLDLLPPEALLQLAKMEVLCSAPAAFIQVMSADSLFESEIRQLDQLRTRIELGAGTYAWKLYMGIHELETRSRSMEPAELVETARLVTGIYMRISSSLMPDETKLKEVAVPDGWFQTLTEELGKLAARVLTMCLNPDDYLSDRLPRAMWEERFKSEAARVAKLLIEVDTLA